MSEDPVSRDGRDGCDGRDVFAVVVEQAIDLLRQATACGGLDVTDGQVRDRVGVALQAKALLDTVFFAALRGVVARPEVVPDAGGDGARAARLLLMHAHRVDPREAGRDVAAAVALDPDTTCLPQVTAAFAEGAITRGHVDAAVAGVNALESWVTSHVMADGTAAMDAVDSRLSEHARALPPAGVRRVTAMLREQVNAPAPEPGRRLRRGWEGRYLRFLPGDAHDDGNVHAYLSLDPVTGAQFRAAIEAAVRHPRFDTMTGSGVREDGEPSTVKDRRSLLQRHADAVAMFVLGRIPRCHPAPAPAASPASGPADTSTTPADAVAGDAVAGDAVAGDAVAGDAVPADAVAGDAVAGDAVAGDAVPADAVAGDAVAGDAVAGDAVPADATPTDAVPADATPTDAMPADATPADAPGDDVAGDDVAGAAMAGAAMAGAAVDEEAVDEEAVDEEAVDEEAVDEEAVDEEAVDEEAVDEEAVDEEAVDEEAVDEEAVDEEAVDEEAVDEEAVDEEAAAGEGEGEVIVLGEPVELSVNLEPQLLIHATADQVAAAAGQAGAAFGLARVEPAGRTDTSGAFVDAAAFANLACLGVLRRVLVAPDGAVLNLGRAYRLATAAQRAAISARDGGCIIPTCTVAVSQCDIHHHTPWSEGGPTDLDNMYAACWLHHREIHAGIWTIVWHHGRPWARPPIHYDRFQRLQRNTTHEITPAAAALGERLRLDHDHTPGRTRFWENDDTG